MKRSYKLMVHLDQYQYVWEGNDIKYFKPQQEYKLTSVFGLSLIYLFAVIEINFCKLCSWINNKFKITENHSN